MSPCLRDVKASFSWAHRGQLFLEGLAAAAAKSPQSCPTLQSQRRQPTRLPRPWDSRGKNTGVGCHFLLQCMKVKSESEVAQSCPTPRDRMECSSPGPSAHGLLQAAVLEWVAIASSSWGVLEPVLGEVGALSRAPSCFYTFLKLLQLKIFSAGVQCFQGSCPDAYRNTCRIHADPVGANKTKNNWIAGCGQKLQIHKAVLKVCNTDRASE